MGSLSVTCLSGSLSKPHLVESGYLCILKQVEINSAPVVAVCHLNPVNYDFAGQSLLMHDPSTRIHFYYLIR